MIVEAVRDDGAVMVTEGIDEYDGGAIVLADGSVAYLPKDSIYVRGDWEPAPGGTLMPSGVDPAQLAAVRVRRVAG